MIDLPTQAGRALIAAGGTGGHVYPALAVAGRLLDSGWSVDWVGTERGIEQRLVPAAGIPLHHLSVSGLRGKNLLARGLGIFRLLRAVMESLAVMRRVQPDVVLGMGGTPQARGPGRLVNATPPRDPRTKRRSGYHESVAGPACEAGVVWSVGSIRNCAPCGGSG